MHGSLRVYRRQPFLPTSLSAWHAPRWKSWSRMLSLFLSLTFLLPSLTWAFDSSGYASAGSFRIVHQNKVVAIPAADGVVRTGWQAGDKLVVLIQDLHCNEEVQDHIARIIDRLAAENGIRFVGIEGASRPVNVSKLGSFPVSEVKAAVGRYLLQQGRIGGPEFYAATGAHPVRLEGIEDEALYRRNLDAARGLLTAEVQGYCCDLREALESLKSSVYNAPLLQFNAERKAYREGRRSLPDYALGLAKRARRQGWNLDAYPNLNLYLREPQAVFPVALDADVLQRELDQLDLSLRAALYTSDEQRELDEFCRRADLIERLVNISATEQEVAEFQSARDAFRPQAFQDFIRRSADPEAGALEPEIGVLDFSLDQADGFYRTADRRSEAFVRNVLDRLQQRGETGAVLVTGGYHTGGILRALKARGVSCLAVTPRLRRQDVANPYYELLQNRRAPLEKLLEKNQTLLALPVRNPEVLPEGETAVLNEANAARYCADTRPETLGRIRTFFNLVQLLLELGLLERLARTGSSESLAERFREVLRDYAAQAGEFSLRLEGLPAQALSGLAALGRGGYGVAEVPVADKPFSVVVCPQGTLKTAEQTACIQFGRMDFVVMTRAQSARANLAERVSQASALLPGLTLPQGSAGLLLLTAGGALLQAGLILRRTWAGARAGLRGGWIAGAAGAWNGLRISAEDALARIRRALPQGIPQSLHPARPALPAAVRSTAAAPLLEALELSDPERIPGAKPVGRWDREGLDVRRIELPAVAIAPDAFPKGVEFLQHELTQAKDRQAVLFDLLYEDNRLIAVFPVVDQERVPDFSAEGPERRLTAADQDAWGLRYLDLSPYYLQLPQPGDPNTAAILEEFARRQARCRSAIAAYKQVRFGPDLAGRIGPVKTDPDQPAGYPDNSYLYLELEPKTGRVSSYQVNLDDLIREPLPYDAEREQMLVPLYPTVYAPNTPTDQQYYSGITTELDLQRGERALVVGPGSGVDTWLTWRRTQSKVRAIGLNPLEVANVRAVAATAGFEVEAVNADNLIAEDGTPRFTGTFDAVLWDTPFIKDIQPAPGQRQLLEDMWDVDYKGRALRRFARGLSTVLKPGGQAWIWRGEDFRERVEAILRSGGETLDPALAALHPVLDVRAVHPTVCLAVKPEAAVTRGLGLTFGMTRALNRLLPSLFGGKGASEQTLLHVAATRVAPWFEPVLTLVPLLAVQSIAVFFGQPLDAGWLIGLSALSHLGFVLSHWKGVYARLEQGSTVIPFGDIGSRAGWLGDRGRLTYWSRLFAAGLAFHLPFYLAFTGVLTGPSAAAFEHAFDLALPLAAVWAVFSHGIYNGLGLGRLNGLSERWLGLGPMDRWFARWRLPLGTMQVSRETPSSGTEAERVPYDPRPVQSKLLHEYFVRFNQIVKAELNPEDRPLVGIYGGAGADIANYLLATNARTTYFVAEYPGLTAADLARLSEYRNYDRQRYGEGWKYLQSYAFSNLVDRKEGFLGALAYELEAIGVDLSTIRADRDGDNPRLQFAWQYAGAAPETYAVTFIDADITRLTKTNLENAARKGIPEKLAQVIRGGFDIYFQRAGWSLPKEYAAPDNYIFALYDNLNRQGAFITDDYAYGFNVKDMGSQFPIPLSERRIPGKNELAGRIIGRIMTKVREPGAYAPAETNPNYRYAWDLRMRVKTGSEEERREVARAFAERAEQTERLYVKAGEALKMSWRVFIGDLSADYSRGCGFWGPILGGGLYLAVAAAVVYARLAKHAPYLPRFGRGEDMQGFAGFDGGSGWTLSYTEDGKVYLDKEALRCLPRSIRALFIAHEEAHRDRRAGEDAAYRAMLDRMLGWRAPSILSRLTSAGRRITPWLGLLLAVGMVFTSGQADGDPGFDARPVEAGLLHSIYIRHDMAVCRTLNPDHESRRAIYGGAGADLSNFLLSTDADEAYFVSDYQGLTAGDLERLAEYRDYDTERYSIWKFKRGYASGDSVSLNRADWPGDRSDDKERLLGALAFELSSLGVDLDSVRVDSDAGHPRIRFAWNYAGRAPRDYAVTFIDGDITVLGKITDSGPLPQGCPGKLREVVRGGFDFYYQRAGMGIPTAYRDSPSFIETLYAGMRPGGYFATDDYSSRITDNAAGMNYAAHFPLPLREIGIPGARKLVSELHRVRRLLVQVSLHYDQLYPDGEDYIKEYGALIRVRQKPTNALGTATAPLASARGTAAAPLLEALELSDPDRIPGAELLADWTLTDSGTDVRRIRLPARKDAAALPRGIGFLQHELSRAPDGETAVFDLLYREGRLLAVYPVLDKEIRRFPAGLNGGKQVTADEQEHWKLRYLDLSPYYLRLPQPGEPDAAARLRAFARRQAQDEQAIQNYHSSRFAPEVARRVAPLETDGHYPGAKYLLMQVDRRDGSVAVDGISTHEIGDYIFPPAPGADRILVPLYPTVYAPNPPVDGEYYQGITNRLGLKKNDRVLVMGPGTGIDVWLVARRTAGRIRTVGLNPLEIASVKATAAAAGFEVEAKVGDNLIAPDGTPCFDEKFDKILWDTPAAVFGLKTGSGSKTRLQDLWDGDHEGDALKRFARGLPALLRPEGEGWIWLGEGFQEPAKAILRSGGKTADPDAAATLPETLRVEQVSYYTCRITRAPGGSSADARNRLRGLFTLGPAGAFKLGTETVSTIEQLIDRAAAAEPSALDEIGNELNRLLNGRITEKRAAANKLLDIAAESRSGAASCLAVAALREALLRGDGEAAEDAAAMLLQAVRKTQVAPEAAEQAFEALYAGAQNANPIIRHHAAAQLGKFLPEARTRTQLARRAADYFLSTLPKTDLHPLRVELWERGRVRSLVAYYAAAVLQTLRLALRKPPEAFPRKNLQPRSAAMKLRRLALEQMKPRLDFAGRTWVQGRTVITETGGNYYAFKLMKKSGERPEDLDYEYRVMDWLHRNRKALGLRGAYPRPVALNGDRAAQIAPEEFPREIRDALAVASREGAFEIARDIEDGSYTAICYAVEDPGYFRYLNDPAEIRTPEAFIAAARTNLHDTYVLARYGIVHTAVIGLFHNPENNRRYRWIEDLAELMRLNSRSTQESGAGRLHNPSAAARWPNARLTGIADMGDLMDVDQATRAGILADTMGNEDKDIRDRKLVLFNFLGEPRLALILIYLDWLRQRGALDEESWKDDALIRNLTRFLRDEVYFETYRIFSGRAALSDEMKAVTDQIDWKRFAVQLVYFMGGAYEEDLARETIPAGIYGPRTQVSLRNPEPAQSWGNIDTALIRNLAPDLVTEELLDHITDRYLNRRSSDRSVTVHQVKQHFNIMEIDADARIPALLKKPLKRLLIKHQYGWRSDGVDTDLGPFNGPNPLTEMILAEYLFSLAMLKDTRPARKDHAPDESTGKPAGLAGVTLEAARVLNRALPGLFGGKDVQADALVRIAATRVAPWFEPLLALAAPVFAAGLLLSLGVMPLLGTGAPWVLLGAMTSLGVKIFSDLHRDEVYVPGRGWVDLNDENRRAYLLKLLPVAVLTVVPWCVVLSGAALPVAATLAGPALALPLLLGAAFALSAGGHWLYNRLALGALRPWFARLGLPLGMAGEDRQSAEDIRYLEGFYTALAATYQGKVVGASEFDRYVELEQAALAEAPADAKTVILQFYEMLLGNRIRQKEACGVLYQTAVESRSAAASELAISILQEAGRRGNDGLVRIALNELGLMLYDDNPNAAARARAQKAMEACLAGPREQVRWYSALKLLNSDAVLSDGVTRRIIDNFGLISMSDSSLVKDAAGGLKHLATDPGTNPKTAAQAVRLMEQWLTESRGFADSLVSRLQALAGQIGEIAVNPETPSDIARQAEEVLKHKLPLKLGLHPLRIELREEGNAPSLIAYFGKTLLRNPLPRLAPPQPFPLKEKKGALHKSDLPKISPAQLRLDLSGARVLGRTVIIERDGEHYALKLLKAGEALEELDYEHRVIEWVSRNSKALGLGGDERDYPAAVFGPGGERIARMSQGDIPAEVLKKLEAASATGRFGIDLQGGEYAYIAYKTADPDYFVYLNDPGVTPNKFKRATKKSLLYLNALAKFGIFHTSTITLFHNLDSLRRYLILVDAIAPMGRNGLKSSGAGRMHGFDEVVQYSNWRANTIADLAELMPLPEIVRGKLLGDDLGYAAESNVVTASFLGEYLLCWTLMYVDWLKNRGELTRKNWNDPKLIRRMAAEMRAAFDFAFESFADRPPSPAMTDYLQAVDWERAARQAAFYLTGAYRQYLVDKNIPADIYGPDMPVIFEADLKRARGWGYLHVSLISEIIHKHLPDRPYMKRRMLAERIQERYLEYVGFDELPPALIGEIARVKTAFDPAQIDQDDVVPDKLKAPLKDLLQEYRHGWRADGIHEDLGPVNGPNPLTELVTALYLYSHAAIHERASAQAGDSGRGDDGRNGKRPETGIDTEEETGLSQELLRLHPWFNRSAWSRTNGRLGWRWLNAMGLSALLFPLFSAAQTTWGYLRTNGDAVLLGTGAVLGALTARVALRAAAQGTEPLRLTPDQKAGLRAGLGLAEGSNLGLVTASEVEARPWARLGMPLVSYRERPGEGPCLVLADGLARRLADGMKAVPGSLRARLAERLFNRLSARALAEWTRSIEDQPAAAGRLGWPAAGIRSAEILILAHGAEAFTLTAAAAGAITGLILAIGIGLPVLAGTLSLGALAGAAAGLFAAGVTARFAPFLPYGERRKLDAVLRAFIQRLFGIAPSHRGKKHIWPSGPRSFLGAA